MNQLNHKWELPEFYMTAGETKYLCLPVYNNSKQLVNIAGLKGRLAISDYINRGVCLFAVECSSNYDAQCGGNVFTAVLPSAQTVNLCGKYIYQLSILDTVESAGEATFGVLRGVVTIGHNADQEAKSVLEEATL